ncbi:MAG: PD40 domain-containing protein [Chloroflexi bacterium]|nr:PD40 domain-containing protein [Chloroflexota bacterium]
MSDKLAWLDKDKATPVDVGMTRADRPDWSPDGKSIVFFGNKALPGLTGPARATASFDLWLMPADCDQLPGGCAANVTLLMSDVRNHTSVRWSPDGKWLVLSADPQGKSEGIWLRNMETGKLVQVLKGDYRHANWSPDGRRLVALGPAPGKTKIELYDNSSALYVIDVSLVVGR